MYIAQTRSSAGLNVHLMSGRTAKRWGRWFVSVWLGMWLHCLAAMLRVAAPRSSGMNTRWHQTFVTRGRGVAWAPSWKRRLGRTGMSAPA
jgi:hypothetical protein